MRGAAGLALPFLISSLFWSGAAGAQTAEAALANAHRMVAGDPCGVDTDEVTVCGRREADRRHRLPLPAERAAPAPPARDGASALAAITPHAPCGVHLGERRCAPHEARLYGYGGGRDPITVGIKVVTRLLDPDAEIAER